MKSQLVAVFSIGSTSYLKIGTKFYSVFLLISIQIDALNLRQVLHGTSFSLHLDLKNYTNFFVPDTFKQDASSMLCHFKTEKYVQIRIHKWLKLN